MPRHIVDKPKSYDSALRLRQFLRIARASVPNPASLILQRRARERPGTLQFIRIAHKQRT
jgi:hypothetical protein